ncbi:MAG: hypothetical protein ACLGPL_05830, partial [Acidobacteriota bacterium]
MRIYYDMLEERINDSLNASVGFGNLLPSGIFKLGGEALNAFGERYRLIKEFQEVTLSLFNASLRGEFDPRLAELVVNELPENLGLEYHRTLSPLQHRTPVFFRTDEVAPGKICEIQCPGSSWGLYDLIHSMFADHCSVFGECASFPKSLSEGFAASLERYLGKPPVVHHLMDNASIPQCVRYFIQGTRRYGVRYFGYDKDVTPYNCNFVRCHDFVGLYHNNFAKLRLSDCDAGLVCFDLPPSALFEVK